MTSLMQSMSSCMKKKTNEDNELHQDFQFEINKWVMKGLSVKAFDEIIKAGTFTGIKDSCVFNH